MHSSSGAEYSPAASISSQRSANYVGIMTACSTVPHRGHLFCAIALPCTCTMSRSCSDSAEIESLPSAKEFDLVDMSSTEGHNAREESPRHYIKMFGCSNFYSLCLYPVQFLQDGFTILSAIFGRYCQCHQPPGLKHGRQCLFTTDLWTYVRRHKSLWRWRYIRRADQQSSIPRKPRIPIHY